MIIIIVNEKCFWSKMVFVLKDCMGIVLSIQNDNLSNNDMLQVSAVNLWVSTKKI